MERITRVNGNGEIYFEIGDRKVVIESIEMLEIAKRLKSYEDGEESGKVFQLPCKPGDTVYTLRGGQLTKHIIRGVSLGLDGIIEFCTKNRVFQVCDIGKTVFLKKEDAEQSAHNRLG